MTPAAVVEMLFTVWITVIIPLLFGDMLPETVLTSALMRLCDQGMFVLCSVCVCVVYMLLSRDEGFLPFLRI